MDSDLEREESFRFCFRLLGGISISVDEFRSYFFVCVPEEKWFTAAAVVVVMLRLLIFFFQLVKAKLFLLEI